MIKPPLLDRLLHVLFGALNINIAMISLCVKHKIRSLLDKSDRGFKNLKVFDYVTRYKIITL